MTLDETLELISWVIAMAMTSYALGYILFTASL